MTDNELVDAVLSGAAPSDRHFLAALHRASAHGRAGLTPVPPVERAIMMATFLHAGQARKGSTIPYVSHVLSVGDLVGRYGSGAPDVQVAALLHDAVEDTGYSLEAIATQFGPLVGSLVNWTTEDMSLKGSDDPIGGQPAAVSPPAAGLTKEASWSARKEQYLQRLAEAPVEAVEVCAADKLHNLEALGRDYDQHGTAVWRRFNSPPSRQGWFYGEVARIVSRRLSSELAHKMADCWHRLEHIFVDPVTAMETITE